MSAADDYFRDNFRAVARHALESAMVLPEAIAGGLAVRPNIDADELDLLDVTGQHLAAVPMRWLRPVDQHLLAGHLVAAVAELEDDDFRTSVSAAIERGEADIAEEVFEDCVTVAVGDWRCLIDRRALVAGPCEREWE